MKKLMIAAAVVMLGIAANAMAVDWKYSGAKADQGSVVYVMLGATAQTQWESVAAIEAAAIGSKDITKNATKYYAQSTVSVDSLTKSNANIYYVIVDSEGKSYSVSSVVDASAMVYDIENKESSPGRFESISPSNMGTPSDFSGAAPEPTSAMLMLLGVAGLALKRKRA